MAGDLTAGADEAHNVGVEGQLALEVHFLLKQLQGLRVQPCIPHSFWSLIMLYMLHKEVHTSDRCVQQGPYMLAVIWIMITDHWLDLSHQARSGLPENLLCSEHALHTIETQEPGS